MLTALASHVIIVWQEAAAASARTAAAALEREMDAKLAAAVSRPQLCDAAAQVSSNNSEQLDAQVAAAACDALHEARHTRASPAASSSPSTWSPLTPAWGSSVSSSPSSAGSTEWSVSSADLLPTAMPLTPASSSTANCACASDPHIGNSTHGLVDVREEWDGGRRAGGPEDPGLAPRRRTAHPKGQAGCKARAVAAAAAASASNDEPYAEGKLASGGKRAIVLQRVEEEVDEGTTLATAVGRAALMMSAPLPPVPDQPQAHSSLTPASSGQARTRETSCQCTPPQMVLSPPLDARGALLPAADTAAAVPAASAAANAATAATAVTVPTGVPAATVADGGGALAPTSTTSSPGASCLPGIRRQGPGARDQGEGPGASCLPAGSRASVGGPSPPRLALVDHGCQAVVPLDQGCQTAVGVDQGCDAMPMPSVPLDQGCQAAVGVDQGCDAMPSEQGCQAGATWLADQGCQTPPAAVLVDRGSQPSMPLLVEQACQYVAPLDPGPWTLEQGCQYAAPLLVEQGCQSLAPPLVEVSCQCTLRPESADEGCQSARSMEMSDQGCQFDAPLLVDEGCQSSGPLLIETGCQPPAPFLVEQGCQAEMPRVMAIDQGCQAFGPLQVEQSCQSSAPLVVEQSCQSHAPLLVDQGCQSARPPRMTDQACQSSACAEAASQPLQPSAALPKPSPAQASQVEPSQGALLPERSHGALGRISQPAAAEPQTECDGTRPIAAPLLGAMFLSAPPRASRAATAAAPAAVPRPASMAVEHPDDEITAGASPCAAVADDAQAACAVEADGACVSLHPAFSFSVPGVGLALGLGVVSSFCLLLLGAAWCSSNLPQRMHQTLASHPHSLPSHPIRPRAIPRRRARLALRQRSAHLGCSRRVPPRTPPHRMARLARAPRCVNRVATRATRAPLELGALVRQTASGRTALLRAAPFESRPDSNGHLCRPLPPPVGPCQSQARLLPMP